MLCFTLLQSFLVSLPFPLLLASLVWHSLNKSSALESFPQALLSREHWLTLDLVNIPLILHNLFLESLHGDSSDNHHPLPCLLSPTSLHMLELQTSTSLSTPTYHLLYLIKCEISHLLTNPTHAVRLSLVARSLIFLFIAGISHNDFHSSGLKKYL